MKSLDKNKTKKLEWEIEFDKWFNHGTKTKPRFLLSSDFYNAIKSFIKSLLLQQKKEILGLECLKEIKHNNFCLHEDVEELDCDCGADEVNKKINQIKKEVKKL